MKIRVIIKYSLTYCNDSLGEDKIIFVKYTGFYPTLTNCDNGIIPLAVS